MVEGPVQKVVVLTGAGVSAESGIRTFRAADGLWEEHRVEDVATPGAFLRDPSLVHRFYNARRRQLLGDESAPAVKPNAAHHALADFERQLTNRELDFVLVTQNVDNLHEVAGSKQVWHMHGELLKMRCSKSGRAVNWLKDCDSNVACTCCQLTGTLRPDIVWFGEVPFHMDEIADRLMNCDVFVSIGTSGNVYPAAGFFQLALSHGAHTVELNLEPSKNATLFDESHYGPASEIVPRYFHELTSALGKER